MNIGPGSWTIRRAARVRLVAGVGAAVCVLLFLVTANRRIIVRSGEWLAGVSSGCVVVGTEVDYPGLRGVIDQPLIGSVRLVTYQNWDFGYATAWRPFRAGNTKHSRLVVPMWPAMIVLACIAGTAHGVMVGRRRTRPGYCPSCGYDVRGLTGAATPPAVAASLPEGAASLPAVASEPRAGSRPGRCPECGYVLSAAGRE